MTLLNRITSVKQSLSNAITGSRPQNIRVALSELRSIRESVDGGSRVGRLSVAKEVGQLLNTVRGLDSALSTGSITEHRIMQLLQSCITRLEVVEDAMYRRAAAAEEDASESLDEHVDTTRIIAVRDQFEVVYAELIHKYVPKLQHREVVYAKAPIALCVTSPIPASRMEAAGVKWVGVSPITVLLNQRIAMVRSEEIDVASITATAEARFKRRFISVTHAIGSRTSSLRIKAVAHTKVLWLMEKGVYDKLAPLNIQDIAFPW